MKKWSLVFNIVLLVLVGVLFYLHFSSKKKQDPVATPVAATSKNDTAPNLRISYVNIDSLEAHYSYFQEKKAELDKKQQSIQNELASKAKSIQNDIAKLQKNASTMTQSEGMAAQKKILNKRKQLQQREQKLRADFVKEQQQFNEDLHQRLNKFLEKYNADKHYSFIFSYSEALSDILYKDKALDITADVIQGLNAETSSAN